MRALVAGIFCASLLFAAPAFAITFNFTGGSGTQANAMNFSKQGLQLAVSTALFDAEYDIYETTPLLDHGSAGLGMKNPYSDKGIGIDGWGKFELAVLSFSQNVVLNSVTLSLISNKFNTTATNVKFRIWNEESGSLADSGITNILAASGAFSVPGAMSGDLFGIGANKRQSEFRIASIDVSLVESALRIARATPSPVPLPATLPLLIAAIGGLVFGHRLSDRRKLST